MNRLSIADSRILNEKTIYYWFEDFEWSSNNFLIKVFELLFVWILFLGLMEKILSSNTVICMKINQQLIRGIYYCLVDFLFRDFESTVQ